MKTGLTVRIDPYVARRAALLHGRRSINELVASLLRRAHTSVADERTSDEQEVLQAIDQGHYEFEQIAEFLEWEIRRPGRSEKANQKTLRWRYLERILAWLIQEGEIEIVERGGKTQGARGAKTKYYVRVSSEKALQRKV